VSVHASRWALDLLERNDDLGETARSCMLILAAEANYTTGAATTSQARLALLLRKHPDTIYRALRQLADVVPVERVSGKGMRWRFPVSPDIPTPRASAGGQVSADIPTPRVATGGQLSTPPAPTRRPPAPTRGDPPRPRGVKGWVSTDVEKEGAAPAVEAITKPTAPQWVVEGIAYGTWIRRERAAGRMEPRKPRKRA
jgi:hypothetical protein